MKIAFTQILALIACALLTACGAGSCVGHNGCSDSSSTTSSSSGVTYSGNTGTVSILAGGSAFKGYADGTGTAALFSGPTALVVDSSGNIYVADRENNRIRKITSAGVVTTFAGSGTSGTANGTGIAATFADPGTITIDSSGNLYVIDAFAATQIRKITPAGVVTSFAGQVGVTGSTDGTGTSALFGGIQGIAIDSSDNLYVTDTSNFKIRKITSAGVVTTFAGSGSSGSVDGTGIAASFTNITALTVDSSGNLYVIDGGNTSDAANTKIRKITSAGVVTTFAGSSSSAYVDGTGTAASFQNIGGITVDSSGNLYVTESGGGNTIRKITSAGIVTTFAGLKDSTDDDIDGTLTAARFQQPYGITIDSSGNLYVAEYEFGFQNNIRKIVFTP